MKSEITPEVIETYNKINVPIEEIPSYSIKRFLERRRDMCVIFSTHTENEVWTKSILQIKNNSSGPNDDLLNPSETLFDSCNEIDVQKEKNMKSPREPSLEELNSIRAELFTAESTDENMRKIKAIDIQIARLTNE